MKYYWVRIYDYKVDDELKEFTDDNVWDAQKGTLLDEYYICGEDMSRDEAKGEVKKKSGISLSDNKVYHFGRMLQKCGISSKHTYKGTVYQVVKIL